MQPILSILLAVVFLTTSTFAGQLAISPATIRTTLEPGEQGSMNFTLQNTGTTSLTSFTFRHTIDTLDNDGDRLTLQFSDPGTLGPGESKLIAVTVTAANHLDFNTYQGTITAASGSEEASVAAAVEVAPVICDFGIAGDDLVLEIEEPDHGDDFEPGETISLDVNVKNQGNRDIDMKVEAFLFGDEEEIVGASSKVMNVDDGDDEDFELSLKIPVDSRRIESDQDYRLFVKAFDDDRERDNCHQQSISIDIELEDEKAIFDREETRFEPSAVTCGGIATAMLHAINIGDEDLEDVYFSLRTAALKINERTASFDLEEFDSDENNAATRRIQFMVPEDAREGRHVFDAVIHYDGKTVSMGLPLEVLSCKKPIPVFANGASLQVSTTVFSAAAGDFLSIPVVISNQGSAGIFSVEAQNIEEFAESLSTPLVQLEHGQRTMFVQLALQDPLDAARYSGSLVLLKEGKVVDSKDFFVDVGKASEEKPLPLLDAFLAAPLWFLILVGGCILVLLFGLVIILTRL